MPAPLFPAKWREPISGCVSLETLLERGPKNGAFGLQTLQTNRSVWPVLKIGKRRPDSMGQLFKEVQTGLNRTVF